MHDRDSLICEVQMALSAARDPEDFGLDLARNRRSIRDLLEEMVRAAQGSGEIDPDIDPAVLAVVLQAATAGIQMLKLEDGDDIDAESAFNLMVRMVWGLRAQHPDTQEG
jgi:AcrR family transcriptional regulator